SRASDNFHERNEKCSHDFQRSRLFGGTFLLEKGTIKNGNMDSRLRGNDEGAAGMTKGLRE
ncbi:MAG: hypothetical protein WCT16_04205, partial [Candidatus Buchananbacteria bacterium]